MKRPVFTAIPLAAFAIPAAAMVLAAPFAHAQTDIEDSCKNSGGQYSQSQVSAHFGQDAQSVRGDAAPALGVEEMRWTKDGVQGPTYGG